MRAREPGDLSSAREKSMRRLFQSLLTLTLALLLARAPLQAAEEVQPVIVKFRGSPAVIDRTAAADSARREQRSRFNDDLPGLTGRAEHLRYDFRHVFNGVALDVNAGAITRIRALPYVEAVYPDVKVHATLLDSAPLIGADREARSFPLLRRHHREQRIRGLDHRVR